jgi:co-chaperonin GroES (HSP10)
MQMLGSAVLIKPDVLPERTQSGTLVIPKNSTEMLPEWGTIIDIGSECNTVKIGDRVNFPRKSANVIVIDGIDHYITNEYKLFYVKGEDEQLYTLNCDRCGKPFQSNMAFSEPHICPSCYI